MTAKKAAMAGAPPPGESRLAWSKTYRVLASRYPPIDLFERIADPADWEMLAAIEGLTNDRLRDQLGDISVVPPEERITGPGASPIMAAFTHIGHPSRFTDGSFGVYYACDRLAGALHEVAYHQYVLARTREPETRLEMRVYIGRARASFHDVRGAWPQVHAPDSYLAGQTLGAGLRAQGSNGVVYDCVRLAGAENLAVFRPKAVAGAPGRPHVTQGPHLFLHWDGLSIGRYLQVGEVDWKPLASSAARPGAVKLLKRAGAPGAAGSAPTQRRSLPAPAPADPTG